jgi:allophanate hydrolase subunit 2
MVLGGVQVPPNGQPVIFLHDHPTTGGYPVVGVVVPDDLAVCAQLRPGEEVTLRVV